MAYSKELPKEQKPVSFGRAHRSFSARLTMMSSSSLALAGGRRPNHCPTESYIAIAALTLGRWETGTFMLPEMLGEAGLVMM